ncbi:unnamed protein product [Amoebophrya sp. A25]|nr:unnamed protein product [Amoebophrya sp. A25]|eukprot:GSA25T00027774001.1
MTSSCATTVVLAADSAVEGVVHSGSPPGLRSLLGTSTSPPAPLRRAVTLGTAAGPMHVTVAKNFMNSGDIQDSSTSPRQPQASVLGPDGAEPHPGGPHTYGAGFPHDRGGVPRYAYPTAPEHVHASGVATIGGPGGGLYYGGPRPHPIGRSHSVAHFRPPQKLLATKSKSRRKSRHLRRLLSLRDDYAGKFIFAGLDRCDALAGVMLKIRMFHGFLADYPRYQNKVLLVQCVYPSTTSMLPADGRNKLVEALQGLVTEVNDAFGEHILLITDEVERDEKLALFRSADVLVDTQVRDGLNLGPFEFLACHQDTRRASLILSEFTGCSRVLQGAIQVNPWNTQQVQAACDRCCRMAIAERVERYTIDMDYCKNHSLLKWALGFLQDLRSARKKDEYSYICYGFGANYRLMSLDAQFRKLETDDVIQSYRTSRTSRVFFLDNEGTLAADLRHLYSRRGAAPTNSEELNSKGAPPRESVLQCLRELSRDPKNIVVVISGRSKTQMQDWFASVPNIGLAAEHGWCYRLPSISGDDWYVTSQGVENGKDSTWKKIVFELLKHYVHRTQGSYIENKGSALVWTYRDSDPEFGRWQAKELSQHLREFMFAFPVEIVEGKGYLEVKLAGVNKGSAVSKILSKISKIRGEPDFILCIGDDRSDEDMFQVINAMRDERAGPDSCSTTDETASDSSTWRQQRSSSIIGGLCNLGSDQMNGAGKRTAYFSCTVGQKPSKAKYFLHDVDEVSDLIDQLRCCVQWSLQRDGDELRAAKGLANLRFGEPVARSATSRSGASVVCSGGGLTSEGTSSTRPSSTLTSKSTSKLSGSSGGDVPAGSNSKKLVSSKRPPEVDVEEVVIRQGDGYDTRDDSTSTSSDEDDGKDINYGSTRGDEQQQRGDKSHLPNAYRGRVSSGSSTRGTTRRRTRQDEKIDTCSRNVESRNHGTNLRSTRNSSGEQRGPCARVHPAAQHRYEESDEEQDDDFCRDDGTARSPPGHDAEQHFSEEHSEHGGGVTEIRQDMHSSSDEDSFSPASRGGNYGENHGKPLSPRNSLPPPKYTRQSASSSCSTALTPDQRETVVVDSN